jgi:probable HAF family extracellular repeat protein
VLQGLKGSSFSEAVAENNHGLSIGYSDTATGDDAILWGAKGGIAAVLRDPGGQGVEFALAINDKGQSVGYADNAGGGTEAVLWQPSGKATNLGSILGSDWSNTKAVGINDLGDTIGYGDYHAVSVSGTFSFLLTPSTSAASAAGLTATGVSMPRSAAAAPEPSTWAMLVAGFAGLGFVGYRGARTRAARREILA